MPLKPPSSASLSDALATAKRNQAQQGAAAGLPAAADEPPGRRLIVCCDGTNNTLTGGIEDTNVLLLYAYLRRHTSPENTVLYYDPGVGTPDAAPPTDLTDWVRRAGERAAALASGRGVYDNIAEAYRFLMTHWQGPQDRIFCFGFSRGAFTARCAVGMVNLFGLIRPEHEPLLPTLIRIYFSQPPAQEQVAGRKSWRRRMTRTLHVWRARPDKAGSEGLQGSEESTRASRNDLARQVRHNFGSDDGRRQAFVHWVGVWDTVESVGLPMLFSRDNPASASFHDKPGIRHVRHALALDEHRWTFLPRLYDSPSEVVLADGRSLKQYWYPGVHCDVGGSYPSAETGLSDASLIWMINEVAPELGLDPLTELPRDDVLPFEDFGMPRHARFPAGRVLRHDALWDTPMWALAGMTVRDMQPRRVATVAQVREARLKGRHDLSHVGLRVDVCAPSLAREDAASVWDQRRKLWTVCLAFAVLLLGCSLSGWSVLKPQQQRLEAAELGMPLGLPSELPLGIGTPTELVLEAPSAGLRPRSPFLSACRFAVDRLGGLAGDGVQALLPADCAPSATGGWTVPEVWASYRNSAPSWALIWEGLGLIGLAYLLARISSRAFTFMAGFRRPGQALPAWRHVGWLPLAAVGLHVAELLLALSCLVLERLQTPLVLPWLLGLVAVLAALKFLAYGANLIVFGGCRLLLVVLPTERVGKVGRGAAAAMSTLGSGLRPG